MMHMNTPHAQTALLRGSEACTGHGAGDARGAGSVSEACGCLWHVHWQGYGRMAAGHPGGALAMAEMLEKARQAPKQAVRQMHSYALGLTDLTGGLMDELARKSAGAGKRGKHRRGSRHGGTVAAMAAPAPYPRTVIRGEKSPPKPRKSPRGTDETHSRLAEVQNGKKPV